MKYSTLLSCLTLLALLSACSSGRYSQKHDSVPTKIPQAHQLKDAVPRQEPRSRGGNRNYTVRGINYQVFDNINNFKERGIASFYGEKFHGHLTSNGEIYDMYAMTAAHKHLPLPTYVKVTNLENQKTVIVRVNDRGPFHVGRIIDLSYSAAYKLGISGTAQVEIETITDFDANGRYVDKSIAPISPVAPLTSSTEIPNQQTKPQSFIQVFATKNENLANNLAQALIALYQKPVKTSESNGISRVIMGPFDDKSAQKTMLETLKANGYEKAFIRNLTLP